MSDPSSVAEAAARAALPRYGIAADAPLRLLNVSENTTFALDDPATGQRSVLRVHRAGYHTAAAIESELDWIAALRADGVVSTPPVLLARDGARVLTAPTAPTGDGSGDGARHVVRFAWVNGEEPAGERLRADFGVLGAVTARLHQHARGWSRPAGFTRFRWDFDTSLGERGHWGGWRDGPGVGPAEADVLGRCAQLLHDRLAAYGAGPDRFGLVHADLRLANLLVEDRTDQVHVIDFDDCGFGWYLYDLGSSLSFIENDPRVPELIDAWVQGYQSVTRLGADDIAELPTFVMLRRLLLLAWLGSHAEVDLARELGAGFGAGSCALAEDYLSTFG